MINHKDIICTITRNLEQKMGVIPVTTGSHAFETHSKIEIEHGDIDFNIYIPNLLSTHISKIKNVLENLLKQQRLDQIITKCSDDRLEIYIHKKNAELRVEILFVEYSSMVDSKKGFTFKLKAGIKVPVEKKYLTKNKYCYVKTLEYMLATWILRVSEIAAKQKREVLDRDYKNLSLLLVQKYSTPLVFKYIKNNPQFPKGCGYTPEEIRKIAINKTKLYVEQSQDCVVIL